MVEGIGGVIRVQGEKGKIRTRGGETEVGSRDVSREK